MALSWVSFRCCCSPEAQDAYEVAMQDEGNNSPVASPSGAGAPALLRAKSGRVLGELTETETLSDASTSDEDSSGRSDREEVVVDKMMNVIKLKLLAQRWRGRMMATRSSELSNLSALDLPRPSKSVVFDSTELPSPSGRRDDAPLMQHTLPGVTLEQLHSELQRNDEEGPLRVFLRDVMSATEVSASPWSEYSGPAAVGSASVQRCRYKLPVKADVPAVVTQALGVPKAVDGTTMNCLSYSRGDLVLMQRSKVQGVKYSDRFRVQSLHVFSEDGKGGVAWCMWAEAICVKPLPWTHSFLQRHIVESTKAEAEMTSPQFVEILKHALGLVQVDSADAKQ
eukprot:TRINITY_DN21859_c0_g1_i1.p1 TRINITY_DN21859_c0_g1~~TRINITY_DN21859_c0_g1_i1.p1  ORF type:complete len:368 (+),score=67.97 TRINITY_DN21859_c0_g1_i1:90-1106(+)